MKMAISGILTLSVVILSAQSGFAAAPSEAEKAKATKAYSEAYQLSIYRNKGLVCEKDAYQSVVLEKLGIATRISPYIKNAARTNKVIFKAVSGALEYFVLTGQVETPAQVAKAFSYSYFETMDGDALGPSRRFQFKPGNQVSVNEVHLTDDLNDVIVTELKGTYTFVPGPGVSGRLTIKIGSEVSEYQLENDEDMGFLLRATGGTNGDLTNHPSECEA